MSISTCRYAELHCISNFTFLRGASHPEELVQRAVELDYTALALTDECSLAGVVRAHMAARELDFQLIIGSEFQLQDGPRLLALVTNREGYGHLSELITQGRRSADKGEYCLARQDLEQRLPGCLVLFLPDYSSGDCKENDTFAQQQYAHWVAETFPGRAWIALELHHGPRDAEHRSFVENLSTATGLPIAAAGDVHMHRRRRRALQDVLTAIRFGTPLKDAGNALHANGEHHLRPRSRLVRLYEPRWLAETLRIAERCRFSLDELRYEYPDDMVPADETPAACLRRLTWAGMQQRWPDGTPEHVRALIAHELDIITELHYEPYFLTVYDIVEFARSRGILCQGRGSAANSAVCYCLGITAVDPSRMQMLFERFVSRERNEPPDIDVDFEHERREEVIQYVYERYGRDRAALAATVITYRRKSALRDVGKALGLSLAQVDRLTGALAWWDEDVPAERVREAGFDPDNPVIQRVLHLVDELRGFPRHLSQHVGGFVIARDRISRLVPIENAAMPDRTVIQWDKDDLDAMGLLKVDCLALGMLTAIHRAFDLIEKHRGRPLTLADVPAEDPTVYEHIQQADVMGVFQIESRAQMSMLPRLRPATFYDLVIEVAIVRPGPIQGNMVHPYLQRRQGLQPVNYPSEEVRGVLERTLGVPIFQEQVIKLAMVAAGFSAGEADQLRRAIGSWRKREKLAHFQQRLVEGMSERGYDAGFARQLFDQIQGFGEYGFPESHAASFALLVYVSAWIKCFEPAAFCCALLNSQPMGFYAPAQLVQDARRHGVEVQPVDVLVSDWDCTLEPCRSTEQPNADDIAPLALRLGLRMVKGLSQAGGLRIMAARRQQAFTSVQDLAHRAGLARKDLDALAASGALERLAGHRFRARWETLGTEGTLPLFDGQSIPETEPRLPEPSEAQNLIADYASLGLTLGRHPLALLRDRLQGMGLPDASGVHELSDGSAVRYAGIVITRQRPSSAAGVTFLTLEDETGVVNIIVWQNVAEQQRRELLQSRLLGIRGKVQREGQVLHIVAHQLHDYSALLGELVTTSRDFC